MKALALDTQDFRPSPLSACRSSRPSFGTTLAVAAAWAMLGAPAGVFAQGSALFAVGESTDGGRKPAAVKQSPALQSSAKQSAASRSTANQSTASQSTASQSTASQSTARPASVKAPAADAAPRKTVTRTRNARGKPAPGASPIAIDGRWHDSECIPLTGVTYRPALYVKRQYEFNDRRKSWQLDAMVYSSDSCLRDSRLLSYSGDGSFVVTGKSSVAASAFEATFRVDRWSAAPENREGVLLLLNGRCGSGDFEVGRPLDLSVTGCSTLGIRSIEQAPREVELVSVSNGKFYLGTRSFVPGLKDDRPAQLSSYGLVRIP